MILEQAIDLFDESIPCDARCITTNGILDSRGHLVMGAGIALKARQRFPALPVLWGAEVARTGSPVVIVTDFEDLRYAMVAFPTKYHWREKSSLELIARSARGLIRATNERGWSRVLLPRPGCKNGGLRWEEDVRPILKDLLDDRFTIVWDGIQ